MTDIKELKRQLIKDGMDLQCCRNCKLCYIREDQEFGFCKYISYGKPVQVPHVVSEFYYCEHWRRKK